MNTIAYCVVHMDTTKTPPRVTSAGVYSESAMTLTGAISNREFAFDLWKAAGVDYDDAKRNLRTALEGEMRSAFGWVLRLIPEERW